MAIFVNYLIFNEMMFLACCLLYQQGIGQRPELQTLHTQGLAQ